MTTHKSWCEKLANSKDLPRVEPIPGRMRRRWGSGTIAIPTPAEVDAIMKQVPRGKLITINEIRALVAAKHGATIACPITTGIFAWIAAHAAEETAAEGKLKITPYWRTLKSGGELNRKYPGGVEQLRKRLEAEGHRVAAKGKRFVVEDYARHLVVGRTSLHSQATLPVRTESDSRISVQVAREVRSVKK